MKLRGILLLALLLAVFVFGCAHNPISYDSPEINEHNEFPTPA